MAAVLVVAEAAVLAAGYGPLREQAAFDADKSVVMIRSVRQDFDYEMPWKQTAMNQGIGSGFIIEGKRVLTNAHNVSNHKYIELKKVNIAKRYRARVSFIGHDCDLAILTVEDESFFDGTAALELAGIPKVNTEVSTYGFPMGGDDISVTVGVVSRIQMDNYAHTGADSHLVIQTDAAINPGNSGGPVMQDGKVVGVAFQGMLAADNIGYMIPTTVIRHFLTDIEDGQYDGFGTLGVMLYPGLHSESYRRFLLVPAGQEGIAIVDTIMHSSSESVFEAGDVITKIDDYEVDNDGRVQMYGLTLDLGEVIENKQIGETAEVTFYRGGEMRKETLTIALNRPVFEYSRLYDIAPRYVCFGGLVFVPATRNFLETWGSEWITELPHYLRYLFTSSMQLNTDRERKEYVVLAEIMPDEINSFSEDFKNQPVESINGEVIRGLDDVHRAFSLPVGGFHTIKFMGDGRVLPIDAEKAKARQGAILQKYNIPAEVRLEETL